MAYPGARIEKKTGGGSKSALSWRGDLPLHTTQTRIRGPFNARPGAPRSDGPAGFGFGFVEFRQILEETRDA